MDFPRTCGRGEDLGVTIHPRGPLADLLNLLLFVDGLRASEAVATRCLPRAALAAGPILKRSSSDEDQMHRAYGGWCAASAPAAPTRRGRYGVGQLRPTTHILVEDRSLVLQIAEAVGSCTRVVVLGVPSAL